ncbi:MAG: DNA polymerase IV [Clostridiales bacterium]|nr:DNA polymerase IV [Clostridiales bacterium]
METYNKVIFHIDVNSAFLSWEAVYRLKSNAGEVDIRNIPSAICGDISTRHGVILAKSIPAKKYGITTGESVTEALKKCPDLYLAKSNSKIYREYSDAFIKTLEEYSPDVEQCSIDEAFIDVSGTKLLFGDPIELANTIKDRIYDELGFTVNIGISDVKLLAKMASDFKKPNRVHTLFKSEIQNKMWPLPVGELFYVGKATQKRLLSLGIRTIGELANTDLAILKSNLKKHGEIIWKLARGEDVSLVEPETVDNKGYGNSTTIAFDVTDASTAKLVLLSLSENVSARMRRQDVKAELISVSIKDFNFHTISHQRVLGAATNITKEIHMVACQLFDEIWDGIPIRLLGIKATKLKGLQTGRQMSLFDYEDYEKLGNADKAIDSIRKRYGNDAVKRASFVTNFKDNK